jgi:hypothetical protein
MNPQDLDPTDYSKPVAYDNQGRPLYAHPPQSANSAPHKTEEPQRVYISRPSDIKNAPLPEEVVRRCEESKRLYPHINLSYGEYVISAVKRHPIGIIQIWLFIFLLIFAFGAFTVLFLNGGSNSFFGSLGDAETLQSLSIAIMIIVSVLGVLGGLAATYIYSNNKFFLTNESVIQEIQTTLFSHHEQTVSLINIEDASYEQRGILPHLLNYGRIRLSTEGDETTYRFNYVSNPKRHIAQLNNAVEAFKNGRSVAAD